MFTKVATYINLHNHASIFAVDEGLQESASLSMAKEAGDTPNLWVSGYIIIIIIIISSSSSSYYICMLFAVLIRINSIPVP